MFHLEAISELFLRNELFGSVLEFKIFAKGEVFGFSPIFSLFFSIRNSRLILRGGILVSASRDIIGVVSQAPIANLRHWFCMVSKIFRLFKLAL